MQVRADVPFDVLHKRAIELGWVKSEVQHNLIMLHYTHPSCPDILVPAKDDVRDYGTVVGSLVRIFAKQAGVSRLAMLESISLRMLGYE